jgi:hypothetical protein
VVWQQSAVHSCPNLVHLTFSRTYGSITPVDQACKQIPYMLANTNSQPELAEQDSTQLQTTEPAAALLRQTWIDWALSASAKLQDYRNIVYHARACICRRLFRSEGVSISFCTMMIISSTVTFATKRITRVGLVCPAATDHTHKMWPTAAGCAQSTAVCE